MWRSSGWRVKVLHVSSARVLNFISRSLKEIGKIYPCRERGSLGGHGGTRSKNSAVSIISACFEWKYYRVGTRLERDANVGLLLGAMGGDISIVGSGSLVDAYSVSR